MIQRFYPYHSLYPWHPKCTLPFDIPITITIYILLKRRIGPWQWTHHISVDTSSHAIFLTVTINIYFHTKYIITSYVNKLFTTLNGADVSVYEANFDSVWQKCSHLNLCFLWLAKCKAHGTKVSFNTLRPRQNGRRFADDTFKRIFLNENVRISIKISLKFVLKGPINNNPALVQIMAWRRWGDKPLSEPMMVSLLTHICVARPQWVNCSLGI